MQFRITGRSYMNTTALGLTPRRHDSEMITTDTM